MKLLENAVNHMTKYDALHVKINTFLLDKPLKLSSKKVLNS